jgi:hypothetical protein
MAFRIAPKLAQRQWPGSIEPTTPSVRRLPADPTERCMWRARCTVAAMQNAVPMSVVDFPSPPFSLHHRHISCLMPAS